MVMGFANQEQFSNNKNEKENMYSIDEIQNNLLGYVEEIEDPRVQRTQKHILKEILAIAILAVIAGSQGWEHMWMEFPNFFVFIKNVARERNFPAFFFIFFR